MSLFFQLPVALKLVCNILQVSAEKQQSRIAKELFNYLQTKCLAVNTTDF